MFRKSSTRASQPVVTNENDGSHPFFARRRASVEEPATTNTTSGGLFSKHRNSSDAVDESGTSSGGLFSKKKNSSDGVSSSNSSGRHLFSKNDQLTVARNHLNAAIKAEKDADEALIASRSAVKSAKSEIATLEKEAKEEARLAKIKVDTASRFRKAGDKLGKH